MNVFISVLTVELVIWAVIIVVFAGYGIGCFFTNMYWKFINWNLKRKGHALNKINY